MTMAQKRIAICVFGTQYAHDYRLALAQAAGSQLQFVECVLVTNAPVSLLQVSPMANPPANTPDPPATQTVRVDTDLLRKAKLICARRPGRAGRTLKLTDYLDSLLRTAIERDYEEALRKIREGDAGEDAS